VGKEDTKEYFRLVEVHRGGTADGLFGIGGGEPGPWKLKEKEGGEGQGERKKAEKPPLEKERPQPFPEKKRKISVCRGGKTGVKWKGERMGGRFRGY